MSTIVSDDYREEQRKLREQLAIQTMARELREAIDSGKVVKDDIAHPTGTPRYAFMKQAIDEYTRRCKVQGVEDVHRTIGSVAEALLALVAEMGGDQPTGNQ